MSDDSPTDHAGVRIFPPAIFIGGLVIGYALEWPWPFPIVPPSWSLVIRLAGVALLGLGLWVMLSALFLFRRRGTPPEPWEPTTTLVLDGPYRFTRNPMYLGMALVLGGFALVGNALWPLLAIVPVIWVVRTQVIAKEERYLAAKFGDAYRDFTTRVRRWF
ncbi:MAG: isoprenylcysteine carboxylmethyltransferase family protein [Bauldia sp.]